LQGKIKKKIDRAWTIAGVVHMSSSSEFKNQRNFLFELEEIINSRKSSEPSESYTSSLLNGPINKVLQKVGEEAVEYIIEAKGSDRVKIISEAADLMYHFIVSLHSQGLSLNDISKELHNRHNK
jgi:phosphoribosyl-ATP pyrophosphohydrolase/phosphoribosyl-AMP cyclohydrolase